MAPEPDGVLGLGDRFTRLEQTLDRIEKKLDTKVDITDFVALTHRVDLVESGETPLAKFLMKQFDDVQTRLNDLVLHGSTQAQDANAQIKQVEKDVEVLRFESQSGRALMSTKQHASERSMRVWGIVLSAAVVLNVSVTTFLTIAHLH